MAPQHPSNRSNTAESGFGYALSEKTSQTDDQRIEEVTPLPPPAAAAVLISSSPPPQAASSVARASAARAWGMFEKERVMDFSGM